MIDVETVKNSLMRGEMFLEYLPTMTLATNRCIGAEALVRWRRGSTVIMPDDFIPLIENTPVSGPITYWVIETVAHELGAWLREHDDVYLSINVPPEILGRGGMEYAAIKSGLADLLPKLIIEVTERGVPDTLGVDGLNKAAEHGIHIALDDVGTQGTNLAVLCRTRIDMVKMNKSFLDEIYSNDKREHGLAALAAIMHAIRLDVVAEGVESAEQAEALKATGIKYAQGFYFSPPLAAKDFQSFYLAHR